MPSRTRTIRSERRTGDMVLYNFLDVPAGTVQEPGAAPCKDRGDGLGVETVDVP